MSPICFLGFLLLRVAVQNHCIEFHLPLYLGSKSYSHLPSHFRAHRTMAPYLILRSFSSRTHVLSSFSVYYLPRFPAAHSQLSTFLLLAPVIAFPQGVPTFTVSYSRQRCGIGPHVFFPYSPHPQQILISSAIASLKCKLRIPPGDTTLSIAYTLLVLIPYFLPLSLFQSLLTDLTHICFSQSC